MNILIPLTILILSWSIDTTDPVVQQRIFYGFWCVHGSILLLAAYIFFCIWRRADQTLVRVKDLYSGEVTVEKAWEYDLGKLRELVMTKIGISAAISSLIATRYSMPFPLLLQSLNNPKAVYYSELFQIYVLGRREEGSLVRPWTESSMVPEWMSNMWAQGEKDAAKITGTARPSK